MASPKFKLSELNLSPEQIQSNINQIQNYFLAMPRRSVRSKSFKKQVVPQHKFKIPEDAPLSDDCDSDVDLSCPSSTGDSCSEDVTLSAETEEEEEDPTDLDEDEAEEVESEPEPAWTKTSRKRKEIFDRSNAHLKPLARTGGVTSRISTPAAMPPAPKKARYMVKPSGKAPSRYSSSSSSKKKTYIDFAMRKAELAESDNIAFIDPLVETLLETFHTVARDVRGGDLSKTGPTFLWGMVGAFVKAVEDTPWGYWSDECRTGEKGEDYEYIMYVNWVWGAQASTLSAAQRKFRLACIGKVVAIFEDQVRAFMSNPNIKIIYSKKFGDNETTIQ